MMNGSPQPVSGTVKITAEGVVVWWQPYYCKDVDLIIQDIVRNSLTLTDTCYAQSLIRTLHHICLISSYSQEMVSIINDKGLHFHSSLINTTWQNEVCLCALLETLLLQWAFTIKSLKRNIHRTKIPFTLLWWQKHLYFHMYVKKQTGFLKHIRQ